MGSVRYLKRRQAGRPSSSKSQHIVTAQLQLNVFGPPELVRGGTPGPGSPVRFRTKKHLAVLLYLHFEGRARPIPRDRLVDLLWPGVSAAKGRHSLSQALLAIRSRLGRQAVIGGEDDVQMLAELSSELSGLHHGASATMAAEPLRGLEDCGSAEFSHWVDGARARLRIQARDALRAALQASRARGDTAEAQRLAAALYEIDPLCAEAVYALAERSLLDRDTVTAVRLLKHHVERARAELGTNPNPEIARLLRRLERGERPAVAAATAALDEGRIRPHALIGREAELGRLEAIANRVVDSARPDYETCLISGTPGIGKSSLIRRFATSLQARAWPVLIVSCQEIGQGIPYAGISELILALGRDPAAGGTDPHSLAEATRVCPGLRAIYPGIPEAPEAPTDSIRLRVAEAVLRMIEAVADNGPVLLAFDDLQFLDPASQEVLFLVTRRPAGGGGGRVLAFILAGARPGEVSGLPWTETVELHPLDRSQALTLIRDLSTDTKPPDAGIRDAIVRLSQGNPYHIEVLLTDWRMHQEDSLVAAESIGDGVALSWAPPEDLRAAFARQYGGLSTDAQHVLQVLAVAGKAMSPHDVLSLLGLTDGASERVVLEMLDRGVGRVEEGRLSFKNELYRAYVYHAMGTDRRMYHHAQFAQRLREGNPLELVHHCIGAGLEQEAMQTGLVAAEMAIEHGAPREAERLLTWLLRAYAVPPESRLRLLLAHALAAAAQYQRALDALDDWRDEAASPTDRALAALIRADALQRARFGGDEAIMRAAQQAIALAEQADATPFLLRANYTRLEVAIDAGDVAARADAEALAAKIAASPASPECVALANLTLGQCALASGEFAAAVERLTLAAPVLESLGLLLELRRVLNTLGISYRGLGRFADATRVFRENVVVSERSGHQGAALQSRLILGNVYHDLGCFGAAVDSMGVVVAALETLTTPRAWAEAYSNIARLALVLGNASEAELAVERCDDGARRSGLWRHKVSALMARADLQLSKGQPALAWPLVEEAARITGDRSHLLPDGGVYERLQHQFLWATRGEALKSIGPRARIAMFDSLVDALEVRLFDEAVASSADDSVAPGWSVLDEAVRMGLLGPLARLSAYGVHHPGVPPRLDGETAAQLIARVFPHPQRTVIPTSVGILGTAGPRPN